MDIRFKILFFIFSTILFLTTNVFISANAFIINAPHVKDILNSNHFVGDWEMQTIVTKSKCPYVFAGSTTKSKLKIKNIFIPDIKKYILKGQWMGGKWKKSKSFIKILNEKEAITERITEIKTNDNNEWKAVLIDHLKLDENNIMHSESIVIQYRNGIPVGDYKTFSILTKEE